MQKFKHTDLMATFNTYNVFLSNIILSFYLSKKIVLINGLVPINKLNHVRNAARTSKILVNKLETNSMATSHNGVGSLWARSCAIINFCPHFRNFNPL